MFHVQTEDRGPARPVIDTVVCQNGRYVLHRRSSNYRRHFVESDEFNHEGLRDRVEEQHLAAELRTCARGRLEPQVAAAAAQDGRPSGIQMQLMNPGSLAYRWTHISGRRACAPGGSWSRELELKVEAFIDGAIEERRYSK